MSALKIEYDDLLNNPHFNTKWETAFECRMKKLHKKMQNLIGTKRKYIRDVIKIEGYFFVYTLNFRTSEGKLLFMGTLAELKQFYMKRL